MTATGDAVWARVPDPITTGEQYIDSLRGRDLRVHYLGQRIGDIVDHPVIRPSINAVARSGRRIWPTTRLSVADRGLREGLLTDMMADDGAWRRNRIRRMQMTRQDRTEGLT